MLTAGEAASLQDARLGPKERAIIASIGDNRPVILARATFATYSNVIGGLQNVMSVQVPANTFAPGDMLRLAIGGVYKNDTGVNNNIGAQLNITQGTSTQAFGLVATTAPSANLIAWRTEILVGVSVAGADGQYLPTMSSAQPTGVRPASLLQNGAVVFAGYGDTLISVADASASFFRGGFLQNTVPATTGSNLAASATQKVFQNSQPMQIDIYVSDCSTANQVITVQAGVLEGL